jgi:iron complex transport system permease protein
MTGCQKIILGLLISLAFICAGTSLGSSSIKPLDTARIILGQTRGLELRDITIVRQLRLPRTLLAFLAGGALGAAGTVFQSVLKNQLASPYVIGLSSGASLGAALVIFCGLRLPSLSGSPGPIPAGLSLPGAGFGAGLLTVLFVIALSARLDRNMSNNTVILLGMVVSLFVNALLGILTALFREELKTLILWQMGSFALKGWASITLMLPFLILGGLGLACSCRELDLLSFGEEEAQAAGLEIRRARGRLFLFASLLAGAAVALCGVIGFVDLIAPHISRRIAGPGHRFALPLSFLTGGCLMIAADLGARTIISPAELPVGAVTALIGAPFFAWVYFRKGGAAGVSAGGGRRFAFPGGKRRTAAPAATEPRSPVSPAPAASPESRGEALLIRNLRAGYGGLDVVKNISLEARPGEFFCIAGPNGSGKSTLLRAAARLIPFRGEVRIGGLSIAGLKRRELARKTALLGQMSQLWFPYTVYDTLALGRYAHSGGGWGFIKSLSPEDRAAVEQVLDRLELADIRGRLITELSGGQLQRVFLARTLVQDPAVILLDEPTNHLDLRHQVELLEYLSGWARENGRAVVAVLHDLNLANRFADRMVLLDRGEIAAAGTGGDLLGKNAAGPALEAAYGMDIRRFMRESLERWEP